MPVGHGRLSSTAGSPGPRMDQEDFYDERRKRDSVRVKSKGDQKDIRQAFAERQRKQQPSPSLSEEQIQEYLRQTGRRSPKLQPGEMVSNQGRSSVDTDKFESAYRTLQSISRRGSQDLAAEKARAQHREMQRLQEIANQTPPAYQGGAQLQGGGGGGGGASSAPQSTSGVKGTVRQMAAQRGWTGNDWNALHQLIQNESGWRPSAANPTSSARGLFQKMESIHGPASSSVRGQANWGLNYIADRYGSPSAALAHWNRQVPINGRNVGHWY